MKQYPPTCELLAQHRGTKADERAIHKQFAAHLVAGREWFRPAQEIRDYIDGIIAVHGRCLDPFKERLNEKRPPVQMRPRSTPYGRGRAVR